MGLEPQFHLIIEVPINFQCSSILLANNNKRKEQLIRNPTTQGNRLLFTKEVICKEVNQESPLNGSHQQNKPSMG